MKILKKLLPVATIASTLGVTVPMFASCGVRANNAYDIFEGTFVRDESTIIAPDTWKLSEATEKYGELVKKNPNIFNDDFSEYLSNLLIKALQELGPDQRIALIEGKCKFNPTKVLIDKSTKTYKGSANLDFDVVISEIELDPDQPTFLYRDATIGLKCRVSMNNFRVKAIETPPTGGVWDQTCPISLTFDYYNNKGIPSLSYFMSEDWCIDVKANLDISKFLGFSGKVKVGLTINSSSENKTVEKFFLIISKFMSEDSERYPAAAFSLGSLRNITVEKDIE